MEVGFAGWLQDLFQMPGDGLPLSIRVGCQVDVGGVFGRLLQLGHYFFAVGGQFVCRGEVVVNIHAKRMLWQVAYVPLGGQHLHGIAQETGDGFCFGR